MSAPPRRPVMPEGLVHHAKLVACTAAGTRRQGACSVQDDLPFPAVFLGREGERDRVGVGVEAEQEAGVLNQVSSVILAYAGAVVEDGNGARQFLVPVPGQHWRRRRRTVWHSHLPVLPAHPQG